MKKILIVDYDQSSLASLQGVLAGQGYDVITAADGQAGWDKYNKESPDLVLMEAMLPKVHGFELCQRITSERNSQATVFIMTGVYKDRVYRTEALRTYGASEYFEKPLKMAELLASVEAVLGKPVPMPAEEPVMVPAPAATNPAAVIIGSVEPRKREKPKSDDSMFALPEDLDRLAREIPKARKPAPAVHERAPEPRLDALADELLKSVLDESKTPKPVAHKPVPENGNGNGNGKAEIDQFLASALAGLDLNKEKVKVPKTAPLPPPPPSATTVLPVKETPVPMPPPVVAKPKPAPLPTPTPTPPPAPPSRPAPAPEPQAPKPAADMKNTLTPGDPGSDLSPFFTPGKARPVAPVEKPKIQPVAAPPAPAPVPKPAKPAVTTGSAAPASATTRSAGPTELAAATKSVSATSGSSPTTGTPKPEPARPAPSSSATSATSATAGLPKPEPLRPEPPRPEPTALDIAKKEMRPTEGGDIFQDFHEAEPEPRSGGFPKIIPIAIGVVAVAAVGFILLRPKRPAPAPIVPRETAQNQAQKDSTLSQPIGQPPANPSGSPAGSGTATPAGNPGTTGASATTGSPVAKPAPAKQKAQPKAKTAEPDPAGVDAILPILNTTSAALLPPGGQTALGGQTQADPQPAKADESAAQKASENASGNAGSGQASDAGAPTVEATPPAAPVKEGDLVELASVTEPPKLIKSADPIYPQTAQRLGVGGSITVNALIDEKGNVIDTGILKGIKDDKGLGRAAETSVRKWKFQPALKNGVAVKVWKSFVIAFKAAANPANRME